jgi:hypothetical protein
VVLVQKQGIVKAILHYGGPLPMQEAHWGPVLDLGLICWHFSFLSIFTYHEQTLKIAETTRRTETLNRFVSIILGQLNMSVNTTCTEF